MKLHTNEKQRNDNFLVYGSQQCFRKAVPEYSIAEAEAEVIQFSQQFNKTPSEYLEALYSTDIWCGRVYNCNILKSVFIEKINK